MAQIFTIGDTKYVYSGDKSMYKIRISPNHTLTPEELLIKRAYTSHIYKNHYDNLSEEKHEKRREYQRSRYMIKKNQNN